MQLWKNFLIRNSTNLKIMRTLATVVGHYGSRNIDNLCSHLQRKQRVLIEVIDDLIRHSYMKSIRRWCESCPGNATLEELLDQELNKRENNENFSYCQWDTTDRAIMTTFAVTYKENKEFLIEVIDDLIRHSYITLLKITSFWYKTKSKATNGA